MSRRCGDARGVPDEPPVRECPRRSRGQTARDGDDRTCRPDPPAPGVARRPGDRSSSIPPAAFDSMVRMDGHTRFRRPTLSVAPMMDCTDRHYRYFMRGITRDTYLYTEMISTGAIVHGDRPWLLDFHECERPLALQIGGSDVSEIARATAIADAWPYDEINLNVGCPSDRVQERGLGACLMLTPELVRDMVQAMREQTGKPVTVKHRIGVDHLDRYEDMKRFVETVAAADPARFTVHARIAWLEGLSPKENRNVPPLRYEDVYRLKREFPELDIELNGHVKSLAQAHAHLEHVDAVMIGRSAYDTPWMFSAADELLAAAPSRQTAATRAQLIERMIPYLQERYEEGTPGRKVVRHMLGLFAGMPGAKLWKRSLSGKLPDNCAPILERMLEELPEESLHAPRDRAPGTPDAMEAGGSAPRDSVLV